MTQTVNSPVNINNNSVRFANPASVSSVNGNQLVNPSPLSGFIRKTIKDEFEIQRNDLRGIIKEPVHQEIASVKVDVENLKSQMVDVNEKVTMLENSKQSGIMDNPACAAATGKAHEVRKISSNFNNAILYGAPELPFFADNLGITTDMDVFKHLISSIEGFEHKITECSRFVNKDKKGQTPLVVTFESRSDLLKLINFSNKLPYNIRVKTDKTKLQREYFADLLKIKDT